MIRITTKYRSVCGKCKGEIPIGATVEYDASGKKVYHIGCPAFAPESEPVTTDAEALAESLGYRLHSEE